MKKAVFSIIGILFAGMVFSQPIDPVAWSFTSEKTSENEFELIFKAEIDMPWHLYAANLPENGPIPTKPHYETSDDYVLIGEIIEPKVKFDEGFRMEVGTIERKAEFRQKVRIQSSKVIIKGEIEYQVCDDANCLPPAYAEFNFTLEAPANIPASDNDKGIKSEIVDQKVPAVNEKNTEETKVNSTSTIADERSLWRFFWIAFGAGLLALLTPCVFPMIPMTVSFFMQGSENRARSIFRGSIFGISIIAIYTLLGLIVSLTNLGPDAANALSTHWIPNLIFFILFLVFAVSFFGMFELVLPSKWVNRADQGADKGGIAGAFFMALTTVLVSFSCTGPIVGALLVEATGGLALKPILGMFGFGLAFAIPFTLFAIFPSLLKGLPKSGGWLNAIKVVLGFIVLAFSLKFLQPLDPSHKIISRETVLIIWTILFFLLGLYLLGKLKFAHDSELTHLKVPRLFLSIVAFVFAIYMFMGLFGANLKIVAPLLPPKSPGWIDMTMLSGSGGPSISNATPISEECTPSLHTDEFHTQYGLVSFYDLEEGIACAEKSGKPIFLDFTGRFCSNCKKMEASVWSDPIVQQMLRNDFVLISLYTDVNKKLPEDQWYTSDIDGKVKKTIGQ
ncbi:cytochrome c biogenesis protein CcdA, partial [Bacteroidota bacterium]